VKKFKAYNLSLNVTGQRAECNRTYKENTGISIYL